MIIKPFSYPWKRVKSTLDRAAGDDALAVGQQHDLEHDTRVIRAGTDFVVVEGRVHGREIQLVLDQVIQRKGKAARNNLLGEFHRQHEAVALAGFVAGHGMRQMLAMHRQRL